MIKLLFLCVENACRSQMAEAFAKIKAPEGVSVFSSGITHGQVNPLSVEVLKEVGIDISSQYAKNIDELNMQDFDIVISLCGSSVEKCPILPGNPPVINWDLPDPAAAAAKGSQKEMMEAFRSVRNRIKQLVDDFFDRGYCSAFAMAKNNTQLILDNISDAIIAHDFNRRIFYFNKAAEKLTGFKQSEVINRDCHEAFGKPLCGSDCLFCESEKQAEWLEHHKRTLRITSCEGEEKTAEMTVKLLTGPDGAKRGVLATLRLLPVNQITKRAKHFAGIVGSSPKIIEVLDSIRDIAHSNAPTLILGESGTGKEMVARAIHEQSGRKDKLFVPINCGALPENLLESELFGHVKGAFTGAVRDKKGRFELADGGTIFLDEIGDVSPAMQVKLLRALQEGTFERVGSEKTTKVDVRIISATNKDISEEITSGRFREDLYYRLGVIPLTLPPLRDRGNDVLIIAEYLMDKARAESKREHVVFSPGAIEAMLSHKWPGNIRELQNWIQYAFLKCKGDFIEPAHLPNFSRSAININIANDSKLKTRRKRKLDTRTVKAALEEASGNKLKASKLLGVGRATLYRFLDDSGLSR